VSAVLEQVATTADELAGEQRQVAREARAMQRLRRRGWSWARLLDHERAPGLVAMLRASARKSTRLVTLFTRGLALGLSEEGFSRRQIAGRLGVTHQRVSALLRRPDRARERS